METSDRPVWRKSSYSDNNGGACVEVATSSAGIRVRDSKDPSGPTLGFSREAWTWFVSEFRARR
ncbi:protein of unknown function [Micromonospora citrea]|uniref:DUF397 domain-containing protein n=1 Tax=Micromonospora citrea TaxID=47855 RepID=A0A1C6U9M3_9ACTN|nr:DUF397 domain-containing protein [Micromonospora citrea]SCL50722.1 protein of unknown function [Micromonospora citrea]